MSVKIIKEDVSIETSQEKRMAMLDVIKFAQSTLSEYNPENRYWATNENPGTYSDSDRQILPVLEFSFMISQVIFKLRSSFNQFGKDDTWDGISFVGCGFGQKLEEWTLDSCKTLTDLTTDVNKIIDYANKKLERYK